MKPAKLYMCMQTHFKHDEDERMAPCVRGHGSVPLSYAGNVVTRTGLHTHAHTVNGHFHVILSIMDEDIKHFNDVKASF